MEMKSEDGLLPGFSDPVQDSMQTFRVIMNAMAHPGRVYGFPLCRNHRRRSILPLGPSA